MIAYPRFPISKLLLVKFPHSMEFQSWKVNFTTEVCAKTAYRHLTMHWIKEVWMAKSIDKLMASRPIVGRTGFLDFGMLDAMTASAEQTSRRAHSLSQKSKSRRAACSDDLRGRHIADMIYEYFRATRERMKQYKDSQTCSVLPCRPTTFKILTFDGIKLYYQQATCLHRRSWKDCTSQNYRILFNFGL